LCKGIFPVLKGLRCPIIGKPYQNPSWFIVPNLESNPFHEQLNIPNLETILQEIKSEYLSSNFFLITSEKSPLPQMGIGKPSFSSKKEKFSLKTPNSFLIL